MAGIDKRAKERIFVDRLFARKGEKSIFGFKIS